MIPKISIITPVYNAGGYLEKAYASIKRQTLTDIEWLIIDDGSNDGSFDIISDLSKKDPRIKPFLQDHKGAGKARNYGLSNAIGEFIAFLDVDDEYYDENALERLYYAGVRKKANVIGSYRITATFDGLVEDPMFREFSIEDEEGEWIDFSCYQDDFHFHSYLYRRAFLDEFKISFPDYKRYQDPVFLLKVLDTVGKVLVLPVVLYKYSFGIQDLDLVGINITDTLKGIRDNLKIASDRNYSLLYKKLIDRLNLFYFETMIRYYSPQLLQVMMEIEDINSNSQLCSNIVYVSMMRKIMSDVKRDFQKDVNDDLLNRYNRVISPTNMIEEYLCERGITEVAVYGIGKFGKMLINDLKETRVKVIAGIDKEAESKDFGMEVYLPENAKKILCDTIIVTPIWYGDMAARISKLGKYRVIILKDLIYKLSS